MSHGTEGQERDAGLAAAAFDALPSQAAVLDSEGDILRTNDEWAAFGRANGLDSAADSVGENYLRVCEESGDEDGEAVAAGLRAVLAGERESMDYEYPCHDPAGEDRWFQLRAIRFGPQPYLLVVHSDVTERKLAELAVREHNAELETLASVLSHDLRNPLNAATLRAELLADETDSEHLAPLRSSLDRLEAIIEDALVLARGNESVTVDAVALETAAENAWTHVDTRSATLSVEPVPAVEADETLLMQLFENLFANAVEHGSTSSRPSDDDAVEHGGDDVTVSVEGIDGGFAVADDGPGIEAENADDIFVVGFTTAPERGTGFGLAIVEKIAAEHGWTVRAVPDADGARFEFTGVTEVE